MFPQHRAGTLAEFGHPIRLSSQADSVRPNRPRLTGQAADQPGRVAPRQGRHNGNDRVKITTAISRLWQGAHDTRQAAARRTWRRDMGYPAWTVPRPTAHRAFPRSTWPQSSLALALVSVAPSQPV